VPTSSAIVPALLSLSVGLDKGCVGRQSKVGGLGDSQHLVAYGFDKNLASCLSQAYKDADRSGQGHEDFCLLSAFWTSAMTRLEAKAEQCKHIRALDLRREFLAMCTLSKHIRALGLRKELLPTINNSLTADHGPERFFDTREFC